MASLSEQAALSQVEQRLTSRYIDLPADRIQSAVQAAHERFEDSKIRDFVPLLVERRVRETLANS
ncbi:three-helix bundle dimerization domain-containing protein [Mycobacterium sp. NPDC006124]|uniref:three-helix bundle dimerization domain-containing protein n=1 Tax=Mycobacterium sp. NPDC006124 TaxID=3156729 RepID=UPI0033B7D931